MSRRLSMLITVVFMAALVAAVPAQDSRVPVTIDELPCSFCHTCDKPTVRFPCLRACPRTSAASIAREMARKSVPDEILLDELVDLYLPVPFDHKGHAEMAGTTVGCGVCHHYTPEGAAQPACKNCHEIATAPGPGPARKPTLKAAYHRQCMGCHREWSRGTRCAACHPPKIGEGRKSPTAKELLEDMPHPIPKPHTKTYVLKSNPPPGANVVFRHQEHVKRFGLQCASCHREESCSRCHEETEDPQQRTRTRAEPHSSCSGCHDVKNKDRCGRCHWRDGETKPKPFDHADTGWPLSKHHARLECRTCHKKPPFRKLDRECSACHGDWEPDTFDHAVTGQVLDENHEEIGCADCHPDRKLDVPPKCDECHDADEGIAFPARRPGPVVLPSRRVDDRAPGG